MAKHTTTPTKTKITKLFGNRVAIRLVEEEYEGLLVPAPGTNNKIHVIGEIVELGVEAPKYLTKGEIVMWQMNAMMKDQITHAVGGEILYVLQCTDVIARLRTRKITLENFSIVGDWALVARTVIQPGVIVLPDTVAATSPDVQVKITLEQKGETFDLPLEAGEDVIVSRAAANQIELDGKTYYYVLKNNVLGARGS